MTLRSLVRCLAVLCMASLVSGAIASAASPPPFFNKELSDAVHSLRDCLSALPPREKRLLVMRSGIGPGDPVGASVVAARLGIPTQSVAHAQWQAVRDMKAAKKAGHCGGASAPASSSQPTATTTPAPAAKTAPVRAAVQASDNGDALSWTSPAVLAVLLLCGICLVGMVRQLTDALRA